MKLKALKQRARSCGVSEELLEDADDADDVRATVIELIVAAQHNSSTNTGELLTDRPHFGKAPLTEPASNVAPCVKHVMLSYQWDHQVQVKRVHDLLTKLGMQCWMDISGGMGADIYDSMAQGMLVCPMRLPRFAYVCTRLFLTHLFLVCASRCVKRVCRGVLHESEVPRE
jgi:hypothetical protein